MEKLRAGLGALETGLGTDNELEAKLRTRRPDSF